MGGVVRGRCGYGTSWGRGVRGRARQPTRVRRSVPISPSTIDLFRKIAAIHPDLTLPLVSREQVNQRRQLSHKRLG